MAERSLLPGDVYRGVWGRAPGLFTHDDLTRDADEPQEDPPRELWAVLVNGSPALQFYASRDFARAGAAGLAKSYPGARIGLGRVALTIEEDG